MPIYEHMCTACGHEWEDEYKMSDSVPDTCPNCGQKGTVKRLISKTEGRVRLGFHENKAKIKEDAKQLMRDSAKDENLRANLVGESKYHKSLIES